jgi:hypothetical protein
MEKQELPKVPLSESDAFPRSKDQEYQHLQEMANEKGLGIKPIGELGYIAYNPENPYVAEAPLILLDWDDTAAQTSKDKEQCWAELASIGMDDDVIAYCDKKSRVVIGDEEATYEPELEMRLLSAAMNFAEHGRISFSPEMKASLDRIRKELIENLNLHDYPVRPEIQGIYDRTRFSSSLYPDTLQTIQDLSGTKEEPHNVSLLTYGDPSFQGAKVFDTVKKSNLKFALLTNTRKGKFFQELIRLNGLSEIPTEYLHEETPRGVGIDFKGWNIPVILFDDDPKQVGSFRSIAEKENIAGLGVVRVRRQGVKRADQETERGTMIAEIRPSDTYLDTDLFAVALAELKDRIRNSEEFDKWFEEVEGELRQVAQMRRDNLILDLSPGELDEMGKLHAHVRRVFEGKDSLGGIGYIAIDRPSVLGTPSKSQ